MRLEIERGESGLAVQYADENVAIATRGPEILLAEPKTYQWRSHLTLPGGISLPPRTADFVDRVSRLGVHFIKRIEGDTFLCLFNRTIFRFNTHTDKTRLLWRLPRGRRVLRNGACILGQNLIVGDYWQNKSRLDVRIHKVDLSSGLASSFLTFPESKIRHVHLIQRDPFTGNLWIGTGDEDAECLLLQVDPADPRLQTIGGGSQRWRAITLVFTENAVYWGSDSHAGSNAIYEFDRVTGNMRAAGSVVGPVYYAVTRGGRIVFGTTVEKGEGDQDGYGRLYAFDYEDGLSEVLSVRKDFWPPRLMGYGVYEFADGPGWDHTFWVTLRGFRGGLQSLLCRLVG